jgi:RHS repeat-associated protein
MGDTRRHKLPVILVLAALAVAFAAPASASFAPIAPAAPVTASSLAASVQTPTPSLGARPSLARTPTGPRPYFGARYYGSKIGRFTTVDPAYTWQENLVDPQRWNRYAYARNNPLRYVDPDGRAIETPWDALNVGIGVASFAANVAAGNVGGAIVDAVGIAYDATAMAVPVLPGGAGTAIRAARAADKAADVVKGGLAPVLKGKEGVEASIAAARARGETILGTEITIETAAARTRIDLATRTREGQMRLIECKNGPCAGLTPNQRAAFPEIGAQGGVPRGQRAAEAGLKPGVSGGVKPRKSDGLAGSAHQGVRFSDWRRA